MNDLVIGGTDAMGTGRLTVRATSFVVSALANVLTATVTGGLLIGIMAVSLWLSWTLTWGDDGPFSIAALVMLCTGLIAGRRLQLSRLFGWSELAIAACSWTLLQPWLSVCLIAPLRLLSVDALGTDLNRFLLGLMCALPVWCVAGVFWSGIAQAIAKSATAESETSTNLAGMAFGIAAGLSLSVLVMAPWLGSWTVLLLATIGLSVFKLVPPGWIPEWKFPGTPGTGISKTAAITSVPETELPIRWEAIRIVAVLIVGGLLAVVMRLVGQLMPGGCQFLFAQWIGLAIGFGVGQLVFAARRSTSLITWPMMMIPAATGGCLIAGFPSLIQMSLWMTASVTIVPLLMLLRVLLLATAVAPLGVALAGLMATSGTTRMNSDSTGNRRQFSGSWLSLVLAIGYASAGFSFGSMNFVWLFSGCCFVLIGLGILSLLLDHATRPGRADWIGLTCCTVLGISIPLWSSHDDPRDIAKLLFSTPAFVAHRAGWDSSLLPMLDDARVIEQRDGIYGRWTLWRSRGMELHLREDGIPRAVISSNTEAHPQSPPAVLQAVLPLVIGNRPQHILILGAGGGVAMETCLQFPVQQVVCAEEDSKLIQILRGPVARETGRDPFSDDRTRLINVPPVMALMSGNDLYDVILSSPPSSAITAGAASFTVDYYQHASRHLADGGIFSQRFEGIDYGPQPLQLVVQSMRQAFLDVIAIETAAGEMLLLATNSKGVFIPEDLTARLEKPHVRRVLAQSGLDWATLLNLPAYDHRALGEICREKWTASNTPANGLLALRAPLELMRWGSKLQAVQQILTANRTTASPFQKADKPVDPEKDIMNPSRKSRMLEWLGDDLVSREVLQRLSEVVGQQKLVQEFPESELHWWEYRKVVRQQLQDRTRSPLKMVAHSDEEAPVHPEDERRKRYFVALGQAQAKQTPAQIAAVEEFLQPYEPLISFFARQEIAELLARSHTNSRAELMYRLHVIYFAPVADASTRNIASTLDLIVRDPQTVPDAAQRFDLLNGLIQTLRTRWEMRQSYQVKSPRMQSTDVDRSVVSIEKALSDMDKLHAEANVSDADWASRRQVIDRILLRPLRTYRTQLQTAMAQRDLKNRTLSQESDENSGDPK